jgi:NAD+ synthase
MNLPSIDFKTITEKITLFLKEEFKKRNKQKAVLAISGGIDSALVAYLCKRAGLDLYGIILPYKGRGDEGKKIAEALNLSQDHIITIDIAPIVDIAEEKINKFTELNQLDRGNIMARQRMIIQYALARNLNALVVGTENLSEYYLGYFTLYGDQACDISPISGLWKTQVRELSKYLELPNWIIEKAPSAGLWEDQTDEKEFGFTYQDADIILYSSKILKYSKEEIVSKHGLEPELVDKVFERVRTTEYKREETPKPF